MLSDHAAVCLADLALLRHVFGLVSDIPCEPDDMVWLSLSFRKNRDDIAQRLLDLCDEIIADQFAFFIPADLAGNENLKARCGNTVGIAFRCGPTLRAGEL